MKKYLSYRGFTLIELLVVITLIAILAVAILAAINPVEQRRKATDTGAIKTATELVSASERYFAQYGCFPWNSTAAGECNDTPDADETGPLGVDTASLNLSFLEDVSEVKGGYVNSIENYASNAYDMQLTADANGVVHVSIDTQAAGNEPLSTCSADCSSCAAAGALYCVPDSGN